MKCSFLFIIFFVLIIPFAKGQNIDSARLNAIFKSETHDTSDVNFLTNAAFQVSFVNLDSGKALAQKALAIAQALHYKKGESDALNAYGEVYHFLGEYPQALQLFFQSLQINRDMKDSATEAETLSYIGMVYNELGQYRQGIQSMMEAITIFHQMHSKYQGGFELSNIGDSYFFLNMPDSSVYYQRKAYEAYMSYPTGVHLKSFILHHMGNAYALSGKNDSALKFYNDAIRYSVSMNDKMNMSMTQHKIAEVYTSVHQYDSAVLYAKRALDNAKSIGSKLRELMASTLLSKVYQEKKNADSALYYLNMTVAIRDSLYGPEKIRQMQLLMLDEQQKQTTLKRQQEAYRNRIRYTALLSGLGVFLLLLFLFWRNIQHKKKSNDLLQKEKQNVEQAYNELKATQAQLIQSEKMASLGELTAGIAHEIQNPLNFVNNFSDVNTELIDEANQEIHNGNIGEVKTILNDIKENEQKINQHGKRADAIVKGMLQHSRSSSGIKEPTDINALCDEYLRLSYHGLRAKDKSFNAKFETNFDSSLPKINVVPQDIGRVILNLINNAFYAASLPSKGGLSNSESNKTPTVWVSTKKDGNKILISVRDNGPGIPDSIKEKIFQPFFTTKPTGQGTGLGLSLSYDIVKAHGGEIKVNTKENEGTEFIISLSS